MLPLSKYSPELLTLFSIDDSEVAKPSSAQQDILLFVSSHT